MERDESDDIAARLENFYRFFSWYFDQASNIDIRSQFTVFCQRNGRCFVSIAMYVILDFID